MLSLSGALALTLLGAMEPSRLYFGINQPLTVSIDPCDDCELVLLSAANEELARAEIAAGQDEIDLAQLFPNLYERTDLIYAQALKAGEPVDSALVLQPMKQTATPVIRYVQQGPSRAPQVVRWNFPPKGAEMMTGFRVYPERNVVLHTNHGDITLALRPDEAPNTAWNFRHLVEGGFYTNVPFHRIVGASAGGHPFVIQAGDPTGTGAGGPGYEIDLEPSNIRHDVGVISMARETDLNTAGSQFFLGLSREATQHLDVQYTAFGHTIDGIDVVKKIGATPTDAQGRATGEMPRIESAELVPAPPRKPGQAPPYLAAPEPKQPEADADEAPVDR